MEQVAALLPCSKKVLGLTPGLSARNYHVLSVHVWVLSGYSGFFPQSTNMTARLIGLSIALRLHEWVAWLFVLCVSGLPCDGLSTCPGCNLYLYVRSGYRKWMDVPSEKVNINDNLSKLKKQFSNIDFIY
ncbi:hypothetical protein GOODEAATRI_006279 [Goodea atripinnis]|uniref:Uncharacterized protein n=1 Tax=Goodea atripinnis TaxID=208336 RepID=A0ABV0PLD5_9TELE